MKLAYLFCLLLLNIFCSNSDDPNRGKVVAIADGDTFTLLTGNRQQVKVRLYGIDCPERGQDFGANAKERLSELIFGKNVRIEEKDKDRYGRIVAVAYTENNICVNEQLLRDGLAWHYREYDNNSQWAALEQRARSQRIGLWGHYRQTPPWEWRSEKRTKKSAAVTAD